MPKPVTTTEKDGLQACDASILGYEYLSGNMIIYTDLAVIGCWGTEEELANQPGPDYEHIDHIIEFINSEF